VTTMKQKKKPEKQDRGRNEEDRELFDLLSPFHKVEIKVQRPFEEAGGNKCLLVVENLKEYSQINLAIIKFFVKKKMQGIYVSANKPAGDIIKHANELKIDVSSVKFIDAISRLAGKPELKAQNIEYVESPKDLVELITTIETSMKKLRKNYCMVFDSASTMLVYNKQNAVEKFVHALAGKIRESDAVGIIVAVESTREEFLNTLAQFCDATIQI